MPQGIWPGSEDQQQTAVKGRATGGRHGATGTMAGDPRLLPTGQTEWLMGLKGTSLGTGWRTSGAWGSGLMETNKERAPGPAVLKASHLQPSI